MRALAGLCVLASALVLIALGVIGEVMHPLYNKTAALWAAIVTYPWLAGIGLACLVFAILAAILLEW